MEGRKIFLILALFMGVSLAYEAPGLFRDRTVPEKWGFLRRNKETRDQAERRKLPHKATGITFANDEFEPYCQSFRQKANLDDEIFRGKRYIAVDTWETFCDPPTNPNNIQMIDDNRHQICNNAMRTYCFTRIEDVKVVFERDDRPFFKITRDRKLHTGCECGSKDELRKR
ncbi:hypothetical protein ACROYT_G025943 [Oculina patagonica]